MPNGTPAAVRDLVESACLYRMPSPQRRAIRWHLLGVTDRGRLAAGQRADLVELDADLRVAASCVPAPWIERGWRGTNDDAHSSYV